MRLFFITAETWPTFRADVAVLFGKYLPRLGIHSDLVAGRTPGEAEQPWGGGEAILADISGGQAKKHVRTFLHYWRALRRLDPARYDAIQVRDLPLPAALALWTARRHGLPFYYWMSYPMPEGQIALARERGLSAGLMKFLFPWVRGRVGRFLLYRLVLPRADHVFVQSERMKADMVARGIPAEKMTPVPMGVDLEAIEAEPVAPADDPRLAGRRVLVYLGTLDRPRRIEVLFDMLARVRREEPAALLVLAGDTHDDVHRAWLQEQARRAGVAEHVVWTGWLPMREGWRYVRAAEVGLSPIPRGPLLDVGSPTKVPEYLALGVPVVCNDNPDQQAIVEASGAGRCVPYTAEVFARAVVELLRLSAEKRQAMAREGARLIAEQRSYERLAELVSRTYRSLVGFDREERAGEVIREAVKE
ncbi:MAG: glycosyltransferase family 4 protein [Candidatus Hydrogenedentes bacterium]|nr:glycosyltransferase family 4 protein [Candidatus Hydrogenedentota bacterium]